MTLNFYSLHISSHIIFLLSILCSQTIWSMPFKTVNLLKRNFIEKNCQNKPSRSVVKNSTWNYTVSECFLLRVTWLLCYRAQVYVLYNLSLIEIGISDFPLCVIFLTSVMCGTRSRIQLKVEENTSGFGVKRKQYSVLLSAFHSIWNIVHVKNRGRYSFILIGGFSNESNRLFAFAQLKLVNSVLKIPKWF